MGRDICPYIFIAALLATAEQKQPIWPLMVNDKQNVVNTYNGILLNLKKEENSEKSYNIYET